MESTSKVLRLITAAVSDLLVHGTTGLLRARHGQSSKSEL